MVDKILAYEPCGDFGHWRRQVHFVAGLGGFGPVADAVLEAAAKTLITAGVPAGLFDDHDLRQLAEPLLSRPAAVRPRDARPTERGQPVLGLHRPRQRAIGRRDARARRRLSDSFESRRAAAVLPPRRADRLLSGVLQRRVRPAARLPGRGNAAQPGRAGGDPVRLAGDDALCHGRAGHRSCCDECFGRQPGNDRRGDRGGQAAHHASRPPKAASGRRSTPWPWRLALEPMPTIWRPNGPSISTCFNLLGDPLMRLPFPRRRDARRRADGRRPASSIEIAGDSPVAGACTVELVVRRDRLTFQPPRRGQFDSAALGEYATVYQRANEPRLASTVIELRRRPLRHTVGRAAGRPRSVSRAGVRRRRRRLRRRGGRRSSRRLRSKARPGCPSTARRKTNRRVPRRWVALVLRLIAAPHGAVGECVGRLVPVAERTYQAEPLVATAMDAVVHHGRTVGLARSACVRRRGVLSVAAPAIACEVVVEVLFLVVVVRHVHKWFLAWGLPPRSKGL